MENKNKVKQKIEFYQSKINTSEVVFFYNKSHSKKSLTLNKDITKKDLENKEQILNKEQIKNYLNYKLTEDHFVNGKYLDQNFYMMREIIKEKKKNKEKKE